MKNWMIVALLMASLHTAAQVQYEVSKDPQNGQKTLKGILNVELLTAEPAFAWMKNDISWYKPNVDCVSRLTAVKDTIQLLVFIGTWCEDSQVIFPQLLKLMDQAGFDKKRFTLVGVDRAKTTLGNLCAALQVTRVPTIVVMKGGKEIGRVEEYGRTGMYDKDLAEVLLLAK